jgi:ApbE superfamily uncharacterized protein (UPF0280 family)
MYQERTYRNRVHSETLRAFKVVVKETDLLVHAPQDLARETRELVLEHRGYVEAYIKTHPDFMTTLTPWQLKGPAPNIISDMTKAGANAGVGPMAAIAGAIAEYVGLGLLYHTDQVIVENGGDIFIRTDGPVTVGIFAGRSPLSMRIGIRVSPERMPAAVCTSSGTVGHSLSLGRSDAVCVVAASCAIADAAATSIGNLVRSPADINDAISAGRRIKHIRGIVVIAGDKMGMWGDLAVIALGGKKG